MGVGKSTLGATLSARLGRRHRDSDADITRLFEAAGSAIAARHGVPYLHELEGGVLLGALADPEPLVISAAASVVERPAVREALTTTAFVIVLHAPADVLASRQQADLARSSHRRPVDLDQLEALIARREPLLAQVADLQIDGTNPTASIVDELLMPS